MARPRRVVQVPGEAEKQGAPEGEQANEPGTEQELAAPVTGGSLPHPDSIDSTKLDRAVLTRDGWLVPDRPADPRQMK